MAEGNDEAWLDEVNIFVRLSPEFEEAVFVRYRDHVFYNRCSALVMQPQTRETIGWLVYEAEGYIIISWDRDADPPTLCGGDQKSSGLVLLKSDIIALKRLRVKANISHKNSKRVLNSPKPIVKDEYAFRPTERKLTKQTSPTGDNNLDSTNHHFSPRYNPQATTNH